MRANQQRLFRHLESNSQQVKVIRGYILKTDNQYYEKGVDVHIAVNLLIGAYENIYDTVILISSDTDLLPAIKKIRKLGKKVEYIGFSHKPSLAMIANASLPRLLTKEDLLPFVSEN